MEPPTKKLRRSIPELPPELWAIVIRFLTNSPSALGASRAVSNTHPLSCCAREIDLRMCAVRLLARKSEFRRTWHIITVQERFAFAPVRTEVGLWRLHVARGFRTTASSMMEEIAEAWDHAAWKVGLKLTVYLETPREYFVGGGAAAMFAILFPHVVKHDLLLPITKICHIVFKHVRYGAEYDLMREFLRVHSETHGWTLVIVEPPELPAEIWTHVLDFLRDAPREIAVLSRVSRTHPLAAEARKVGPLGAASNKFLSSFATADRGEAADAFRIMGKLLGLPALSVNRVVSPTLTYMELKDEWRGIGDRFLGVVKFLLDGMFNESHGTQMQIIGDTILFLDSLRSGICSLKLDFEGFKDGLMRPIKTPATLVRNLRGSDKTMRDVMGMTLARLPGPDTRDDYVTIRFVTVLRLAKILNIRAESDIPECAPDIFEGHLI